MTSPPRSIRALQDEQTLEVAWDDAAVYRLPLKFLRCECPCAACVDEITGQRLLDPATVPETVKPTRLSFTGNYALKIDWSDGHSTGMYTWPHLERLCQRPEVAVRRV